MGVSFILPHFPVHNKNFNGKISKAGYE
jgi:hypothetical protein